MTYDFDIEEAFNIWGYEKHYYDKCRNDQNVLDYYKKNGEQYSIEIPVKVEGGFISTSYIYSKNAFKNRDILLKLYVSIELKFNATDKDIEMK